MQALRNAIEQLYGQCRTTGHCHVLLDPQAGMPFDEEIAALNKELAPRAYLCDPLFKDVPRNAPTLLRLPMSEFSLIESMAARAQGEAIDANNSPRSICGFLQSTLSLSNLVAQLSWALDLKVEQQRIYFRYFDPRVIFHLARLLPDGFLGHLLQGMTSWSYFRWDGSFVVQGIPESSEQRPIKLQLMSAQWQELEFIEHFNATQRLFAKQGWQVEPEQAAELFAQVRAARASGLQFPEDVAHYVACSRHANSPLSQHPAWPDVMMLLKQEVPLAEALSQLFGVILPPARWHMHLA